MNICQFIQDNFMAILNLLIGIPGAILAVVELMKKPWNKNQGIYRKKNNKGIAIFLVVIISLIIINILVKHYWGINKCFLFIREGIIYIELLITLLTALFAVVRYLPTNKNNVLEKIRSKISECSPVKIIVVGSVLIFVNIAICIYAKDLVRVPEVVGKEYSDAKNMLIECGLNFNTEHGKENISVINQVPEAGDVVKEDTIVELTLETVIFTPTPTSTSTPTPTLMPTSLPKYKVTFDSNGGSMVAKQVVTYGDILRNLPKPTRDYYTFTGWTYNGQKVTSINVEHDMVLVADWEANSYTVTFDGNGGSLSSESKSVTYGETYGTLPNATRIGYTFKGWYTSASGGNRITNATLVSIAKNHTVYGQWTQNAYVVSFDANGGSCTTGCNQVLYAGTYGTLPTPTRENYTFDGWYTATSGGTKITSATAVSMATNHTLYAKWTPYKTMYVYYHYTNGDIGEFSVCPYSGMKDNGYKWNQKDIYREEIWLDNPLKVNKVTYGHSTTTSCQKVGCTEENWSDHPYYDVDYNSNKVIWYNQKTILVPASTTEGVRR